MTATGYACQSRRKGSKPARESSLLQVPHAQPIAANDPLHAVTFALDVAARQQWAAGQRTDVLGMLIGEAS